MAEKTKNLRVRYRQVKSGNFENVKSVHVHLVLSSHFKDEETEFQRS